MPNNTWEAFKKQFPKGAKVQLNVGSPIMSVKDYRDANPRAHFPDDQTILCQWFSGKKLESGYFAPDTLVLVKDDGEENQSS